MRSIALATLVVLAACASGPAAVAPPLALAKADAEPAKTPVGRWAGSPERGHALVQTRCAGCHSVGQTDESPLAVAPPFRDLQRRYPVEDLAEALAEGIDTAHPAMPEFVFEPDQIADLIAYLKTLEATPGARIPEPHS